VCFPAGGNSAALISFLPPENTMMPRSGSRVDGTSKQAHPPLASGHHPGFEGIFKEAGSHLNALEFYLSESVQAAGVRGTLCW